MAGSTGLGGAKFCCPGEALVRESERSRQQEKLNAVVDTGAGRRRQRRPPLVVHGRDRDEGPRQMKTWNVTFRERSRHLHTRRPVLRLHHPWWTERVAHDRLSRTGRFRK